MYWTCTLYLSLRGIRAASINSYTWVKYLAKYPDPKSGLTSASLIMIVSVTRPLDAPWVAVAVRAHLE